MSAKQQLPCSLVIERALTVAGIERRAILSCGTDQHHIYCSAYYQNFIDDAENKLADCEREKAALQSNVDRVVEEPNSSDDYINHLERKLAAAREALHLAQEIIGLCDCNHGDDGDLKRRYYAALTEAGEEK